MEKFQEFVSLAPWTIIFTWINLIILVFIMKKLLFKPVTNMLKQREDEVNAMYEKAETAQKNAEALEKEYSESLSGAKEEAARIVKEATKEAALKGEQIVAEAKKDAANVKSKAEKEIMLEKEAAVNEIKNDIASMVVSVAEKVIEKDIDEKDHERLVEDFINSRGDNR